LLNIAKQEIVLCCKLVYNLNLVSYQFCDKLINIYINWQSSFVCVCVRRKQICRDNF